MEEVSKNILEKENESRLLTIGSSPHIRSNNSTFKIMLDVIIALTPAALFSVYLFGIKALLLILVSAASAVISEYSYEKLLGKELTVRDLSAIITGILIAFNVPIGFPLWKLILGNVFAIVIVKQLFGGIGQNFMNPALAARALLVASWPTDMTNFYSDFTTAATPLSGGKEITLIDAFIGKTPGCIGEVSVLALLIGAVYLIVKRVIDPKIPTIFIFTTIITLILTGTNINAIPIQIFSGGIILGAFYMATDYSTSPVSSKGRCIYALGCGFITAIIRRFGALPEGVSYAILFMNILTPLIEKLTVPKSFGGGKNERKS